jgi:hypothetical protein
MLTARVTELTRRLYTPASGAWKGAAIGRVLPGRSRSWFSHTEAVVSSTALQTLAGDELQVSGPPADSYPPPCGTAAFRGQPSQGAGKSSAAGAPGIGTRAPVCGRKRAPGALRRLFADPVHARGPRAVSGELRLRRGVVPPSMHRLYLPGLPGSALGHYCPSDTHPNGPGRSSSDSTDQGWVRKRG